MRRTRACAALSFADGTEEADAFASTLQTLISGATGVEGDERDCTPSSTTSDLDFTVTISGAAARTGTPDAVQSDVQTAIYSTTFQTVLAASALQQGIDTLDSVAVTTVTVILATPPPTPRPTPISPNPTPRPYTYGDDYVVSGSHRASGMVLSAICSAVLATALM